MIRNRNMRPQRRRVRTRYLRTMPAAAAKAKTHTITALCSHHNRTRKMNTLNQAVPVVHNLEKWAPNDSGGAGRGWLWALGYGEQHVQPFEADHILRADTQARR